MEADLKSEREALREVVRNLNVPSAITSDSALSWEPGTPPPTPASSASARAALAPLIVEWGWKEPPPTFAVSQSGVGNYDADEGLLYDQRSKITPFVAK